MAMEEPIDVSIPNQDQSITHTAISEKVLKQSEVNAIVGQVRQEAYEKAKRDAQAEFKASNESSFGGMQQQTQQRSDADIRKMIDEQAEKRASQIWAQQTYEQFSQKMGRGKEKFSDFDEKIAELDLVNNPNLAHLANSVDNTDEVMYEIASNSGKLATLLTLSVANPRRAAREIAALSESIRQNHAGIAENTPTAKEPLRQIKPSIAGTDSGVMTHDDWRKLPWLKG